MSEFFSMASGEGSRVGSTKKTCVMSQEVVPS